MVDDEVFAWNFDGEFDDRCAARKNGGGLDILVDGGVFADGRFRIDGVKDFTNDMEGRDEVHSPIANIEANFIADFGLESRFRFDFAVEGNIVGIGVEKGFGVEWHEAFFAKLAHSIEFALDEIEFFIYFCEWCFRFDKD